MKRLASYARVCFPLLLVAVACNDSATPSQDGSPPPSDVEARYKQLIDGYQTVAFSATYDLDVSGDSGSAQFAWLRLDSHTRWDEVDVNDRGIGGQTGLLFPDGRTIGCLWSWNSAREQADATCTPGHFVFFDLDRALTPVFVAGDLVQFEGYRTILGMATECFSSLTFGPGTVCWSGEGVPLSIETRVNLADRFVEYKLTAIEVHETPDLQNFQELVIPGAGESSVESKLRNVKLEELQLPPLPIAQDFLAKHD